MAQVLPFLKEAPIPDPAETDLKGEVIRSRPGKPNQRKGQNEKFMDVAHFCLCVCV